MKCSIWYDCLAQGVASKIPRTTDSFVDGSPTHRQELNKPIVNLVLDLVETCLNKNQSHMLHILYSEIKWKWCLISYSVHS